MWKSVFLFRDATYFSPQANVDNIFVFHSFFREKTDAYLSTVFISTFHSLCGKNQRQELMFAVMSRMLFCSVTSPDFSACSTLRME